MKSKYKHVKSEKFVDKYIIKGIKRILSNNSRLEEKKGKHIPVHLNTEKKEKYKPKHLKESEPRGIKALFLKRSKNKNQYSKPKRYTGCGIMKKVKAFALAAAVGLSASTYATTLETEVNPINDSNNSLTEELSGKVNESLENMEIIVDKDNKSHKISLNPTIEKDDKAEETLKKIDISRLHSAVKKDYILESELAGESGNISETESVVEESDIPVAESANEVDDTSGPGEENINSESEINPLAMAEFRISEDDMLTEGEILYAFTKLMQEWKGPEKEIENVKGMMNALLRVQKEFGINPLAILAIMHWESHCGLDYEQYNQIRVANNESWITPDGRYIQIGVIGYSKAYNYCLFDTVDNAVYDFGNYITNSWALEGAKTMWDLEYNKDLHIFNGASREGAYMYDKLKQYAKEYRTLYEIKVEEDSAEVTIYDISQIVGSCMQENAQQWAETITSKVQDKNQVNKESQVVEGER